MGNTITVEKHAVYPVIMMTWARKIDKADVINSFQEINTILDESNVQLWVVVDLVANPIFPMLETISNAMRGPYQHPKLEKWLVINGNPMAKTIERVLSHTTGIRKVEWFDTGEDVWAYVEDILDTRDTAS